MKCSTAVVFLIVWFGLVTGLSAQNLTEGDTNASLSQVTSPSGQIITADKIRWSAPQTRNFSSVQMGQQAGTNQSGLGQFESIRAASNQKPTLAPEILVT